MRRTDRDGLSAAVPDAVPPFFGTRKYRGISLTNSDFIRWPELGDMLIEFADRSGRIFPENPACMQVVCFSTCEGLHAAKMAPRKRVCPFVGIVGPPKPLEWADSLTAYIVFYHNACYNHIEVPEAIKRMNTAIGRTDSFSAFIYTQLGFPEECATDP